MPLWIRGMCGKRPVERLAGSEAISYRMAAFSWGGVGMKSGKFLTFGIVALLLPGMTMAQMAPPCTMMDGMAARLPSDPTKVTTSDAMRIMDRHSACLVSMHADMADMAIGPFPKRSRAARALSQPGIESCLQSSKAGKHVRMATNFELLRGSVYKARYRQRHSAAQPVFVRLATDWTQIAAGMKADEAKRFTIFHKIAECTLAAAPEPVHQIVIADYGSDAQKTAFMRLAPVIGDCLPEGLQLELPRPSLAGALAEVAYRSAEAKAP